MPSIMFNVLINSDPTAWTLLREGKRCPCYHLMQICSLETRRFPIFKSFFSWVSYHNQKFKCKLYVCVCTQLLQSWPTLCNSMGCSLPGSFVYGILQQKLEWIAMPSSRVPSWCRDQTRVSCISCPGILVSFVCLDRFCLRFICTSSSGGPLRLARGSPVVTPALLSSRGREWEVWEESICEWTLHPPSHLGSLQVIYF